MAWRLDDRFHYMLNRVKDNPYAILRVTMVYPVMGGEIFRLSLT